MDAKTVTWLGEDDQHEIIETNDKGEITKSPGAGPSKTYLGFGDTKVWFEKDKPVLIDPSKAKSEQERMQLEQILKKAPNSKQFKVSDVGKGHDDDEHGDEDEGDVEQRDEAEHGEPRKGKRKR